MKKLLSTFIVLCLIFSLTPFTAEAKTEDVVTVSAMIYGQVGAELSSDQLTFKKVEEVTGVKFDFTNVPGADYAQKVQVTLASGDIPDIIEESGVDFAEYIHAGTFMPLNDLYDNYGVNVMRRMDEMGVTNDLKFTDGNFYIIPKLMDRAFNINNHINNRWLVETNQEMPTTIEELYDVLKVFKEYYGVDSVPFGCGIWAGTKDSIINNVCLSYGFSRGIYYYGDKYAYAAYDMSEQYKAALVWLNKAYSEGLLDQQMFATSDDDIMKYYTSDRVGFFRGWADGFALWGDGGSYGQDIIPAPVLDSEFGPGKEIGTSPLTAKFYVSAKSDKGEAIMRAFDYAFSDEGMTLFNWGIEGTTFEVDADGKKSFTDLVMGNEGGPVLGRYTNGLVPPHFPCFADKESEYELNNPLTAEFEALVEGKTLPLQPQLAPTMEETSEYAGIMTDIDKYVAEQEMLFITGQLSIADNFDAFVSQLQRMGIERAVEIRNTQLERYLNK